MTSISPEFSIVNNRIRAVLLRDAGAISRRRTTTSEKSNDDQYYRQLGREIQCTTPYVSSEAVAAELRTAPSGGVIGVQNLSVLSPCM